MEYC
jgi:hypothetical protein